MRVAFPFIKTFPDTSMIIIIVLTLHNRYFYTYEIK